MCMTKRYYAHSSDCERGVNTPQFYSDHIHGTRDNAIKFLMRKKKFFSPDVFDAIHKIVCIAAEYHDLGKLDDQPQSILSGICTEEQAGKMMNHVDAGVAHCVNLYLENGKAEYILAAFVVMSHHVGMFDFSKVFNFRSRLTGRKLEAIRKDGFRDFKISSHVDANLDSYINRHNSEISSKIPDVEISEKTLGRFFQEHMLLKVAMSLLADGDSTDTAKFYGAYPSDIYGSLNPAMRIEKLKSHVKSLGSSTTASSGMASRAKMRQRLFEACDSISEFKDVTIVDATVGSGKTISGMCCALRIAERFDYDSINVVLPQIALIEQSSDVYKNLLLGGRTEERYAINQVHHLIEGSSWFHRRYCKDFNSAINVSTSANFFNILSSNKVGFIRRLHKFVGSVIFIDEYHILTSEKQLWPSIILILEEMCRCLNCKVILSTGTPKRYWESPVVKALVMERMKDIHYVINDSDYEEMEKMESSRVSFNNISEKGDIGFEELSRMVMSHDSDILCAFTTVKKVKAFARYLKDSGCDSRIFVRCRQITPRHRLEQLSQIKRLMSKQGRTQSDKVVLVVSEGGDVGMDLSFSCAYKEISSFDAALQISGRVNRNCEMPSAGIVTLFSLSRTPMGDGVEFFGNPGLNSSISAFRNIKCGSNDITIKDCQEFTDSEMESMGYESYSEMAGLVSSYLNNQYESFGEAFTIIKSPSISLLVDNDIYQKIVSMDKDVTAIDIEMNSVGVYPNQKKLDEWMEKGLIFPFEKGEDDSRGIQSRIYFWRGIYTPEFGLEEDSPPMEIIV